MALPPASDQYATDEGKEILRGLAAMLGAVATTSPTMSVAMLRSIVTLAVHENTSLKEITERAQGTGSSVSRQFGELGGRKMRVPHEDAYVTWKTDERDSRIKLFSLGTAGQKLANVLVAAAIGKEVPDEASDLPPIRIIGGG